jgi:GDPmannose 4,6-dehydratase
VVNAAAGETYSVKQYVEEAFKIVGIKDWQKYVVSDNPKYLRPAEVDYLIGDYTKAKKVLGWQPKTKFTALVKMMVDSALEQEKKK